MSTNTIVSDPAILRSKTVRAAGFSGKENGELLTLAEKTFDVIVTIDANIPYQQNIASPKIAVLIIRPTSNDFDDIRPHVLQALDALHSIKSGQVVEVGCLS